MKKLILLFILSITINLAYSQDEEINVAGLVFLKYQSGLPKNILSTKTVVLVSSPNKVGESIPEDWQPLAVQAHPVLTKAGMDPVAYYFYDDVYSGKETRAAFATAWKKRGVEHILLLMKSELNNNNKNIRYLLLATPFNGESTLMTEGQPAWKSNGKKFNKVLDKLARVANRQERKNLLTTDSPEYFDDVKLIEGQRAETYYTDLKMGKMAVPKFAGTNLPGKRPGGLVNNLVQNRLQQAEDQANKFNGELATIMQGYKFKYELVDNAKTDKELMIDGYTYVIYSIHTSGLEIRKLLNYGDIDEEEEYYITVKMNKNKPTMRYIPIKAPVYKYYIKNLKTKTVYLGKQWDADETWQESLKNVLYNISREVK
ncbi:MAG: hypothetical protein DRI71_04445 [Bacteroidetes bacterium]|nr:MAG: hypothetical protein DRI71_04445 [Bacteroidota bacterium]